MVMWHKKTKKPEELETGQCTSRARPAGVVQGLHGTDYLQLYFLGMLSKAIRTMWSVTLLCKQCERDGRCEYVVHVLCDSGEI